MSLQVPTWASGVSQQAGPTLFPCCRTSGNQLQSHREAKASASPPLLVGQQLCLQLDQLPNLPVP